MPSEPSSAAGSTASDQVRIDGWLMLFLTVRVAARVASDRKNTCGESMAFIRMRSPSSAPPPRRRVGSTAITAIDVLAKLEDLAAKHKEKLNWKVSIVDLLKLLGIDSSLHARKELATELGCPAEKMGDSAQMNIWLHKTVLKKLADNGGNIPKELLE